MARGSAVHRLRRDLVLVCDPSAPIPDARRLERHEVARVRLALQGRAGLLSSVHATLERGFARPSPERMWRDIEAALHAGRLAAFEMPSAPIRTGLPGDEPIVAPERVERKETTWVGIELVDQDGQPVAYQRVRIVLPSGETRDLKLDEHGRLRLTGIDPGACEIAFPDLDGREWQPA